MKNIYIYHAYDGFLYAPLFVAKKSGYFHPNIKLHPALGDIEAIAPLGGRHPDDGGKIYFAIGDPFAWDINREQHVIKGIPLPNGDGVVIIGAMIIKMPIWLYHNGKNFPTVLEHEDDLFKYKEWFKKIVCYKRFNTGYMMGSRLTRSGISKIKTLDERPFGEEFNQLSDDSLIVTNDILRIKNDIDIKNRKVIFEYAMHENSSLNPYLFTAILTLKSVINNNLHIVLSVLSGLRTAITRLANEYLNPEHITLLINHNFGEYFNSKNNDQKKILIETSINKLFREDKIYDEGSELFFLRQAYNNAKDKWDDILPVKFPAVEEFIDPIPGLLIKKDWKESVKHHLCVGSKVAVTPVPLLSEDPEQPFGNQPNRESGCGDQNSPGETQPVLIDKSIFWKIGLSAIPIFILIGLLFYYFNVFNLYPFIQRLGTTSILISVLITIPLAALGYSIHNIISARTYAIRYKKKESENYQTCLWLFVAQCVTFVALIIFAFIKINEGAFLTCFLGNMVLMGLSKTYFIHLKNEKIENDK
jgi:hypothetical protein